MTDPYQTKNIPLLVTNRALQDNRDTLLPVLGGEGTKHPLISKIITHHMGRVSFTHTQVIGYVHVQKKKKKKKKGGD